VVNHTAGSATWDRGRWSRIILGDAPDRYRGLHSDRPAPLTPLGDSHGDSHQSRRSVRGGRGLGVEARQIRPGGGVPRLGRRDLRLRGSVELEARAALARSKRSSRRWRPRWGPTGAPGPRRPVRGRRLLRPVGGNRDGASGSPPILKVPERMIESATLHARGGETAEFRSLVHTWSALVSRDLGSSDWSMRHVEGRDTSCAGAVWNERRASAGPVHGQDAAR
jgi:hypothetical protein